jgi:FkbM family methyltransferase
MFKRLLRRGISMLGYDVQRIDRAEADPYRFVASIFRGRSLSTVLDVGAHEGDTAIRLVEAFPKALVHCFEPFKGSFEVLIRKSAAYPRIRTYNCALADSVGQRILNVNKFSATNSLLESSSRACEIVSGDWMDSVSTSDVRTTTLDAWCVEQKISFIDLLKMDVQGFESRVLTGGEAMLAQGKVAAVLAEVLFAPLYKDQCFFHDIYDRMWSLGFRLAGTYELSRNSSHYLSWCDALFIHPEVMAERLSS